MLLKWVSVVVVIWYPCRRSVAKASFDIQNPIKEGDEKSLCWNQVHWKGRESQIAAVGKLKRRNYTNQKLIFPVNCDEHHFHIRHWMNHNKLQWRSPVETHNMHCNVIYSQFKCKTSQFNYSGIWNALCVSRHLFHPPKEAYKVWVINLATHTLLDISIGRPPVHSFHGPQLRSLPLPFICG